MRIPHPARSMNHACFHLSKRVSFLLHVHDLDLRVASGYIVAEKAMVFSTKTWFRTFWNFISTELCSWCRRKECTVPCMYILTTQKRRWCNDVWIYCVDILIYMCVCHEMLVQNGISIGYHISKLQLKEQIRRFWATSVLTGSPRPSWTDGSLLSSYSATQPVQSAAKKDAARKCRAPSPHGKGLRKKTYNTAPRAKWWLHLRCKSRRNTESAVSQCAKMSILISEVFLHKNPTRNSPRLLHQAGKRLSQ